MKIGRGMRLQRANLPVIRAMQAIELMGRLTFETSTADPPELWKCFERRLDGRVVRRTDLEWLFHQFPMSVDGGTVRPRPFATPKPKRIKGPLAPLMLLFATHGQASMRPLGCVPCPQV